VRHDGCDEVALAAYTLPPPYTFLVVPKYLGGRLQA